MQKDSADEKEVFVPDRILKDFGCKNCIWKQHGQCPEGFTKPKQVHKDGCCKQLGAFLIELRATSDSLSQMKEKFFLYSQELQSISDRTKFHELQQKHDELCEKKPESEKETKKLNKEKREIEMAITSYRLYWERLTTAIVKGLAKVGDREQRKRSATDEAPKQITVQNLNVLIQNAREYLDANPEGNPDEKSRITTIQTEP